MAADSNTSLRECKLKLYSLYSSRTDIKRLNVEFNAVPNSSDFPRYLSPTPSITPSAIFKSTPADAKALPLFCKIAETLLISCDPKRLAWAILLLVSTADSPLKLKAAKTLERYCPASSDDMRPAADKAKTARLMVFSAVVFLLNSGLIPIRPCCILIISIVATPLWLLSSFAL